ncbi:MULTISPECIES: hypothetical protein [unclassified Bradyrhizobium]|uniref:hypothetical protein n=1 Tax=unclassified Bradyrhizobium TaxID=2631580 RepID=UPI00339A70F5
MAWRTVDGVEYLTRYTRQDGKQKVKSRGRRSPETDAIFEQFESTVLKARASGGSCGTTSCCPASWRRLTASPASWTSGRDPRLALVHGRQQPALAVRRDRPPRLRSASGVLAPTALVKDQDLQFVARTEDLETLNLDEIARPATSIRRVAPTNTTTTGI